MSWLWGEKYGIDYVRRLADGLERHVTQPYRTILVTDQKIEPGLFDQVTPIPNPELLEHKGCLVRLRMFDPTWQVLHGISYGHRLVCIDLDVVITGELDPLFARLEPFIILGGANAANPCPFNGSLMMLRGGAHPEVWSDFSVEAVSALPCHEFPDDQGWIAHKIPNAATWQVGEGGLYAFCKNGWPKGPLLPDDARLVVFPGWRDPSRFLHLPWIAERW